MRSSGNDREAIFPQVELGASRARDANPDLRKAWRRLRPDNRPSMSTTATSLTHKTSTSRMCGVVRVLDGEAGAVAMLAEQAELWDRLTMEEGRFRKRFRALLHASSPELAQVDAELIAIRQDTSNAINSPATARNRVRELSANGAALRKTAIRACKTQIQELDNLHALSLRTITSDSGIWWLHAEAVLHNFRTARAEALRAGRYLWSKPFFGEGSLSVRFTAGGIKIDWEGFEAGKSRLASITEPTTEIMGSRMKALKGDGGRRYVLEVAISAPGIDGKYPTISLLVTLHRDMPRDLTIRTLTLRRSVSAAGKGSSTWSASFTFGGQRIAPQPPSRAKPHGVVLPHISAAVVPIGEILRVATSTIGDNACPVLLSAEWLAANRLVTARRERQRTAIAALHAALTAALVGRTDLMDDPETSGMVSAITTGPPSVSALLRMIDCQEAAVARFGSHLGVSLSTSALDLVRQMTESDRTSRRLVEQRLHVFRNVASQLVRQCSAIAIGQPVPQAANATDEERADRRSASYGLLLSCIQHAAKRDGIPVTMYKTGIRSKRTRIKAPRPAG